MSQTRLEKAAQISDTAVTTLGAKWAVVESQSSADTYTVDLTGEPSCTCPDHVYRGTTCKHMYRAAEALEVFDLPDDD